MIPRDVIVILGMHRSGTSCLAGSLQEAGLHLGDVVTEAPHNVKGNRENRRIMELHDEVLRASGGRWDHPPARVMWDAPHRDERDRIVEGYAGVRRWGFKDPRTLVVLDGWREIIPEMRFVGTFRHPLAVAASLRRRNGGSEADWVRLWVSYNERLLALHDAHAFPLVSFDDEPGQYAARVTAIARALGLPDAGAERFFEGGLRHNRVAPGAPVPDEVRRLYDALRARVG